MGLQLVAKGRQIVEQLGVNSLKGSNGWLMEEEVQY